MQPGYRTVPQCLRVTTSLWLKQKTARTNSIQMAKRRGPKYGFKRLRYGKGIQRGLKFGDCVSIEIRTVCHLQSVTLYCRTFEHVELSQAAIDLELFPPCNLLDGSYLVHFLHTSQGSSGRQKVPDLHSHLVSLVLVHFSVVNWPVRSETERERRDDRDQATQ